MSNNRKKQPRPEILAAYDYTNSIAQNKIAYVLVVDDKGYAQYLSEGLISKGMEVHTKSDELTGTYSVIVRSDDHKLTTEQVDYIDYVLGALMPVNMT